MVENSCDGAWAADAGGWRQSIGSAMAVVSGAGRRFYLDGRLLPTVGLAALGKGAGEVPSLQRTGRQASRWESELAMSEQELHWNASTGLLAELAALGPHHRS